MVLVVSKVTPALPFLSYPFPGVVVQAIKPKKDVREGEPLAKLVTKRPFWLVPWLIPFPSAGCRTGYGEKLSRTQAEPGHAINSAVVYFPSISCATSYRVAL